MGKEEAQLNEQEKPFEKEHLRLQPYLDIKTPHIVQKAPHLFHKTGIDSLEQIKTHTKQLKQLQSAVDILHEKVENLSKKIGHAPEISSEARALPTVKEKFSIKSWATKMASKTPLSR